MRNLRRKRDTPTVVLSTFSANRMDTPQTADASIFKAPADVHRFSLARNDGTSSYQMLAGVLRFVLVCHGHPALEQQFFDIAQAQLKAEVPAHGATDDCNWKTVAVIGRCRFLHLANLLDRTANLTMPCKLLPEYIRRSTQSTSMRSPRTRVLRFLHEFSCNQDKTSRGLTLLQGRLLE
jgi:hypothetical protein